MKTKETEHMYKESLAQWILDLVDTPYLHEVAGQLCVVRENHRDGAIVYQFEDRSMLVYDDGEYYTGAQLLYD